MLGESRFPVVLKGNLQKMRLWKRPPENSYWGSMLKNDALSAVIMGARSNYSAMYTYRLSIAVEIASHLMP